MVRLRCPGRTRIHTGFLKNVSHAGMFLRILNPEVTGVRLGFDVFFTREDGSQEKFSGEGEVVWSRPEFEGPDLPPGMGIRFLSIEPGGPEILSRILAAEGSETVQKASTVVPMLGVSDDRSDDIAESHGALKDSLDLPSDEWEDSSESSLAASASSARRLWIVLVLTVVVALAGWWWLSVSQHEAEPLDAASPALAVNSSEPPVGPTTLDSADSGDSSQVAIEEPLAGLGGAPDGPTPEGATPIGGTASRVLDVRVEAGDEVSLVTVVGDGALEPSRVDESYIGGESPRIVLQVSGVERFGDRLQATFESGWVRGFRTGFHALEGGTTGRLHVVLEVSSSSARVLRYQSSGNELLIYVGSRDELAADP